MNFEHDPGFTHAWRMPTGERTTTHPVVREKVQEMLDKEDRDFGGVLSTAKTALTLYSDPLVAQNTAASDFTINDLVNHSRPVSLYLVVPPSDKIRLRPLIRLMFTMVVNRLTERMVFEGAEQKRNRHRLLLLIDEFPSPQSDGDLRRRSLVHGRIRSQGIPDHAGHPPDRGCVRAEREHRFQLPCPNCVRSEPVRDRGTAEQDDRHHHGSESQLQLLRFALFAGDGPCQRERGPHRASADDAR